jgi:hypothetical protein
MAKNGSLSFRAHYGVTELHPIGPPEKRFSFWCTELRPSYPSKSPWALSVSRHTTKPRRTSSDTKMSALLAQEDGNLLLKMHGTARHSSAIRSGSCVAESSRWMIWCSGGCLLGRVPTRSPQLRVTLLSDLSLPSRMHPPGFGRWRNIAEPLEHRTPPSVLYIMQW